MKKIILILLTLVSAVCVTIVACGTYEPYSFEADGVLYSASIQNGEAMILHLNNESGRSWHIKETSDGFTSDYSSVVEGTSEFHIIALKKGKSSMRFQCALSDGTREEYVLTLSISRHQGKYLQIDTLSFVKDEDSIS